VRRIPEYRIEPLTDEIAERAENDLVAKAEIHQA
jgi:hypothetical protein